MENKIGLFRRRTLNPTNLGSFYKYPVHRHTRANHRDKVVVIRHGLKGQGIPRIQSECNVFIFVHFVYYLHTFVIPRNYVSNQYNELGKRRRDDCLGMPWKEACADCGDLWAVNRLGHSDTIQFKCQHSSPQVQSIILLICMFCELRNR